MAHVTVELSDKALAALRFGPEEAARELRFSAAAAWYSHGRVSQEVAAEIAGMDRTDFLLALARDGVDSFQVDFRDLDRELARG